MPGTIYVGEKCQMTIKRLFSVANGPSIVELTDGTFVRMDKTPIQTKEEIAHLPSPHYERALTQLKGSVERQDAPEPEKGGTLYPKGSKMPQRKGGRPKKVTEPPTNVPGEELAKKLRTELNRELKELDKQYTGGEASIAGTVPASKFGI